MEESVHYKVSRFFFYSGARPLNLNRLGIHSKCSRKKALQSAVLDTTTQGIMTSVKTLGVIWSEE